MKLDLMDILDMRLEEIYNNLRNNRLSVVELELKKIGIEEDIAVLERYSKHFKAAVESINRVLDKRTGNDNNRED
jgi:hypothetical protein